MKRFFLYAALLLLPLMNAAAQTVTVHFDELPGQPANGVNFEGVTFSYARGGAPSNDALYNTPGIGTLTYLDDPALIGMTDGTLTLTFDTPISSLSFGVARDSLDALTAGASVALYGAGGQLVGNYAVALNPLVVFSEGLFKYSGTEVKSAVITFSDPASSGTFALDNLTLPAVCGRVHLEGVPDLAATDPAAPLGLFHIEFRAPGTTNAVHSADVPVKPVGAGSPFGNYCVAGVPAGTYDVAVKGDKNLRVLIANATIGGSGTLPDILLPGGDANDDNSVDTSDFGILVGSYGGSSAVSGSGYDPSTDFNFDGVVDATDFGILVGDYNTTGAP